MRWYFPQNHAKRTCYANLQGQEYKNLVLIELWLVSVLQLLTNILEKSYEYATTLAYNNFKF